MLRSALILLATFTLISFFTVPAEDLPETAYDESESLPYEMTPLLSGNIVQESAPAPQIMPIGRSDSLTMPRQALGRAGCRELAAHHRPNSLIILDHTLRC